MNNAHHHWCDSFSLAQWRVRRVDKPHWPTTYRWFTANHRNFTKVFASKVIMHIPYIFPAAWNLSHTFIIFDQVSSYLSHTFIIFDKHGRDQLTTTLFT